MRKTIAALLLGLTLATLGVSQTGLKIITYPLVPKRDILDRLGLAMAWHVRIPTDRLRDGIYSVQVIPANPHPQLAVQTRAGALMLLDSETGETLWRAEPAVPYWTMTPVGYNSNSIFATRREQLFILDRATGMQRLYTEDPVLKMREFGMRLPAAPSAAAVADDDIVYFVMGNRVQAYVLPEYGVKVRRLARKRSFERPTIPILDTDRDKLTQPELLWTHTLDGYVLQTPPVVSHEHVGVAASDGTFFSFDKYERQLIYDFKTRGPIAAAPGQHRETVYLASEDRGLYALNITREQVFWRFLSGGPLLRQPLVTDNDIFLFAPGIGMYRLDRETGRDWWVNERADQFLANNHRFVYAMDRKGNLMVLDYARGSFLGYYDMRDWQVPVSNPWNDRVYFANHDGQILCLHYRDNRFPVRTKEMPVLRVPVPAEPKLPMEEPKAVEEKAP